MRVVFNPRISQNEIYLAQIFPAKQIPALGPEQIYREKRRIKRPLIIFTYVVAGIVLGGDWLAMLLHLNQPKTTAIIALSVIPFLIIMQLIIRGLPPRQSTPEEAARTFYAQASHQHYFDAFRTLASTILGRAEATTLPSFAAVWDETVETVEHELARQVNLPDADKTLFKIDTNKMRISTLEQSDRVVTLQCEMPLQVMGRSGVRETAELEFHNMAVRVDKKWYLLASDPGEPTFMRS